MMPKLKNVLLLNGIVTRADAISRILCLKREALLGRFGGDVRVDIAAYAIEDGFENAHCVPGIVELMELEAFQRADLLIYEFGIFYDLFGSVRFKPPQARTIAVWHNVTPPDLIANSGGSALMERSIAQISNMLHCDQVQCDSEFNAATLEGLGFDSARIRIVAPPVSKAILQLGAKPWNRVNCCLKILFVGRFVSSKGVLDLMQAITTALRSVPCNVELSLVGNVALSDPTYLRQVMNQVKISTARVDFRGTLNEENLAEAFHTADIFVMPSYHEGYCVPAVEALAAGCHVIAYDSGNLPAILGNNGALVPCGDVATLSEVLMDCFKEHGLAVEEEREPAYATGYGAIPETQRRLRVRRYAAGFSEAVYAEEFLAAVSTMYSGSPVQTALAC